MTQVQIYSAAVCPYAHRTRLTLLEKAVNFQLSKIDWQNKADWFTSISPDGKVPVIEHSGQIKFHRRFATTTPKNKNQPRFSGA